jgi:hypothetical protein
MYSAPAVYKEQTGAMMNMGFSVADMNRLLEIGFEPAGHWVPRNDELVFELSRHATRRNILYAFVIDGEVKYIGKTIRTLVARMRGYKNPGSDQPTNSNNNANIKSALKSGAIVKILALPDNGLLHFGQFHVNLAAGLEDSLIREIGPQWNGGRTDPAVPHAEPDSEENELQVPPPIKSFTLVVQKTYYDQGFFNVSVNNADLFGSDGEDIEILCGDAEQPIIGLINRTANSNETPRIMGRRELRDWFQQNMQEMQEAKITVLSPTAIRIEPSKD